MNGYFAKQGYNRSLCITISVFFPSFISLPAIAFDKPLVYLLKDLFEQGSCYFEDYGYDGCNGNLLSYSILRVIAGISTFSVGTEGGDRSLPLKISTFVVTPPKNCTIKQKIKHLQP